MNELDWLRQTRALNQRVAPRRDLWPQVADAIAAPALAARRRNPWPWALTATCVLAVAGFATWTLRDARRPAGSPDTDTAQAALWQPQDPRLVAAAADLDVAHATLARALEVTPDAAYLHRLLERTAQTRDRLQNLEHSALARPVLERPVLEQSAG